VTTRGCLLVASDSRHSVQSHVPSGTPLGIFVIKHKTLVKKEALQILILLIRITFLKINVAPFMFKYRPTNYRAIRKIFKGLYQPRYTNFRDDRLGKNSDGNG